MSHHNTVLFIFFITLSSKCFLVNAQLLTKYYDFSNNAVDPGLRIPCSSGSTGVWTFKNVNEYPSAPGAPTTGTVFASPVSSSACMETIDSFNITSKSKFSIQLYIPFTSSDNFLKVWLINKQNNYYQWVEIKGPIEENNRWQERTFDVPSGLGISDGIYKVSVWDYAGNDSLAIRYFEITNGIIITTSSSSSTSSTSTTELATETTERYTGTTVTGTGTTERYTGTTVTGTTERPTTKLQNRRKYYRNTQPRLILKSDKYNETKTNELKKTTERLTTKRTTERFSKTTERQTAVENSTTTESTRTSSETSTDHTITTTTPLIDITTSTTSESTTSKTQTESPGTEATPVKEFQPWGFVLGLLIGIIIMCVVYCCWYLIIIFLCKDKKNNNDQVNIPRLKVVSDSLSKITITSRDKNK